MSIKIFDISKRTIKFDVFATIDDKLIANVKHTRIIISKKVIDRKLKEDSIDEVELPYVK